MAERKYSLNFVTSAELSGAKAAEAAVGKVGDAAQASGAKAAGMEDEFSKAMARLKAKIEEAREGLREAGEKAGQGTAEGMGAGLELAANMHLVQQSWDLGTVIGQKLGEAMVMAWEGTLYERADEILAPWSKAASARMAARLRADVQQEMREVYAEIQRDQQAFWRDYMNAAPKNAGDWLDEIKAKADAASKALRNVSIMQNAEGDDRVAQIEADAAEKKDLINSRPGSDADKRREMMRVDLEKEAALFEERSKRRAEAVANEQAAAALKASEVQRLREAEELQQQRAKVEQEAAARAQAQIASTEAGGSKLTDAQKQAIRDQAFQQASDRAGVQVKPGQNEGAELTKIRDQRFAAEKAAKDAADAAEVKRRETALRDAMDAEKTVRNNERTQREIANVQDAPPEVTQAAPPRIVPPGQEQTPMGSADDLREQLRQASQATGSADLKAAMEQLKSRLADGASAQELREAAALMERAQSDNNDAVRQMAGVMRTGIEAQRSSLAALKQELDGVRTAISALQTGLQQ
jgi:hypothetical protein